MQYLTTNLHYTQHWDMTITEKKMLYEHVSTINTYLLSQGRVHWLKNI